MIHLGRISFILFFILITLNLYSQYKGESSIGVNVQSNYFQIYNSNDWNNLPHSFPVSSEFPNSWKVGLNYDYNISDQISLKMRSLYSNQFQKYTASSASTGEIYDRDIIIKLKYFEVPLSINYFIPIGGSNNLYFNTYLGTQVSYTIDYYAKLEAYLIESGPIINYDKIRLFEETTPYKSHIELKKNDELEIQDLETNFLFNKIIVGLHGGLSVEKYIKNIFKLNIGLEFYHAIISTENINDRKVGVLDYGQRNDDFGDTKSYNRSLGLFFSCKYIINPQSTY